MQEYQPAGSFASEGFLAKAARRLGAFLAGPTAADLEPRKGAGEVQDLQQVGNIRRQTGQERDAKERRFIVNPAQMRMLADQDDIVFSIRRTLKAAIRQLDWKIVPDLDNIKDDVSRWSQIVALRVQMPGLPLDFAPQAISAQIYTAATGPLVDLITDLIQTEGVTPDRLGDHPRYRQFFENVVAAHEAIARSHVGTVKTLFERPNPSAESSFPALLNLLVDAITLYDAGVVIKNPTMDGKLGELYTIPGEEVEIYQNKDLSTPQPPFIAYHWKKDGQIKALYNNLELVYMMANPQQNGYGKSPLDVLISQMVGTRYADAYFIDWFQNDNIPPFVFDLGPNVPKGERDAYEQMWNQRISSRGKHRGLFISTKEGVKGFLPVPLQTSKDMEILEQLKFWANRKCAAFGLSLNDIGFTEDLHRTTAETQADLTQSRGVLSLAEVIQGYINGEIVKGAMWVRENPDDPNSLAGEMKPCFPFRDVKFEFISDESQARLQVAEAMLPLISSGVVTINEGRHELGYAPAPGGDELVNFAMGVKVRDLPDLPGPSDQQAMQGGEDGQPQQGGGDQPALAPGGQPQLAPGGASAQVSLGKAVNEIDQLANRLSKLAGG